jgi:hypothetical protein
LLKRGFFHDTRAGDYSRIHTNREYDQLATYGCRDPWYTTPAKEIKVTNKVWALADREGGWLRVHKVGVVDVDDCAFVW